MQKIIARVNTPISAAELERRWAAVRAAMAEQRIDALLMQGNNSHHGGYLRYLADVVAGGYPTSIVFPRDDLMTVVRHGPAGGVRDLPDGTDGVLRGVKQVLTTSHFPAVHYVRDYDAALAVRALQPHVRGTIGLLGTTQMAYSFVDHVKHELPDATFVDASELVDRIKVIKSDEEQQLIARTAELQDGAMQAAADAISAGKLEAEVIAAAQFWSQCRGSEYGAYLCGSAPAGEPAQFYPPHMAQRRIDDGDVISILVENSGAGGYFAELGRTFVLGRAVQQLVDELEFTLEAQRFCLGMLKPGMPSAGIWKAYNDFMRKNGRPEEDRIHCHGQGYDLVERPLIRFDEPMSIQEGMNITCHPSYVHNGMWSWICDNYLIGADGPGPSLHRFPQQIVEL
jgi:Xaa-Pro aminopeptidase